MKPAFKLAFLDLDDTLVSTTADMQGDPSRVEKLRLLPFARECLASMRFPKVLVTTGDVMLQFEKVKRLFLYHALNKMIVVRLNKEKLFRFRACIKKYHITDPREVLVIGNRIDCEIRFGNYLGCTTILIKHGKYATLKPRDALEIPCHEVTSWKEIRTFLEGD